MIVSPNKHAAAGLSLGSKLDFFTVTTAAITAGVDTTGANLSALIEVIAINGQPVISALDTTAGTLKFAVEHTGAWTAATLQAAIIAAEVESVNVSAYPLTYSGATVFTDAVVVQNTL